MLIYYVFCKKKVNVFQNKILISMPNILSDLDENYS